YDYLRARWSDLHAAAGSPGGTFETFWRETLRTGVASLGEPADSGAVALVAPDRELSFEAPTLAGAGLVLLVPPSSRFGDGSVANRAWLQELPDPVSKITWHSWIEIHPDTAEEHGLRKGDIVKVTSPHGDLEVPVWTYPGIRRNTVAIS